MRLTWSDFLLTALAKDLTASDFLLTALAEKLT